MIDEEQRISELKSRVVTKESPTSSMNGPLIRGTRVPILNILDSLASGETVDEILYSYPSLVREDVFAAIAYASARVKSDLGDEE